MAVAEAHTETRSFGWYQASVASFLVPDGMLEVLFPYLVVVYLAESPQRVGQAQMALTLPGLLLVLIGGVIADRMDRRRMLLALHALNTLPPLALLIALGFGRLTYPAMLAFGLASGTALAFVRPVLDAVLNRISGPDIQRAVSTTVTMTYGMHLLGYFLASNADRLGIGPVLGIYAAVMASGAWSTSRLPAVPPASSAPRRALLREIGEGIDAVVHSRRMLPPALLNFFSGFFLGGPYAVLVPLILRDIYGGRATGIALAFTTFIAGGATSTTWLRRLGGVSRPGRALILGYVFSGIALLIWSTGVPYAPFLLAIAFWGFGGGMCHSMGRSIMQEAAPPALQARVMSVFYLGGMLTGPLGALAISYVIAALGLLRAALAAGIGTIAFCILVVLVTDIWNDRAESLPS